MDALHAWFVDAGLVIALLIAFGGAAVLAVFEVSLLRVRPSRVRVDAGQGDQRAIQLLDLLADLPAVLNSVLFSVLLCQVAVASISGYLAQRWFGGMWIPVVSITVSLLLFVYAESLPKTMAVSAPYEQALRSAGNLRRLTRVCRPLVEALVAFAGLHVRGTETSTDVVSERELRLLARQAAQAGEIGVADADLVDRSFRFGDQLVSDVMVDRENIVALSVDLAVDDALTAALAAGHRRLPVFGNDLDDVVGAVRLRDLAAARGTQGALVGPRMRAPLFCSPHDSIAQLIEQMRASGKWLAIVRDADGQTLGLATVEDIVAELMGEIEDPPAIVSRREDD
jgi:putative hemolysin